MANLLSEEDVKMLNSKAKQFAPLLLHLAEFLDSSSNIDGAVEEYCERLEGAIKQLHEQVDSEGNYLSFKRGVFLSAKTVAEMFAVAMRGKSANNV